MGLSGTAPFPLGTANAYRDAIHALRSRNLLVRSGWIHETQTAQEPPFRPLPFREYEEELRLAVQSAHEGQVEAAAGKLFGDIRRWDRITVDHLELWKQEFALFQARWVMDGTEVPELAVPLEADGCLSLSVWEQRITEQLLKLADLHTRQLREDRHIIYEIAHYLREHAEEEISLQDIADRFYLSREYISRKFKQAFKENLSDYIARIRIEKSKLLLLNPDYRLSRIALQVGYQDEKYFSKVFKKLTGLSPGEYRRKAGGDDGS
jgi:two-component system response regulator YesN